MSGPSVLNSLTPKQVDALTTQHGRGALLVVDVQRSFGDPAYLGRLSAPAAAAVAAAVEAVARAVSVARASRTDVVWVELRVRPDDPWAASNWFRGIGAGDPWPNEYEPCVDGTPGAEWYGVSPLVGETVVSKRTYDGFYETPLDEILRSKGIGWVTVAGLTSDCCVFTTASSAFSHGYPVVVLRDASASYDPAVHESAMTILSLHSAMVSTVDEMAAVWEVTA